MSRSLTTFLVGLTLAALMTTAASADSFGGKPIHAVPVSNNSQATFKPRKAKLVAPRQVIPGEPFDVRLSKSVRSENVITQFVRADCPKKFDCYGEFDIDTQPGHVVSAKNGTAEFQTSVYPTYYRALRNGKPRPVRFRDGDRIQLVTYSIKYRDQKLKGNRPGVDGTIAIGVRKAFISLP